MEIRIKSNDRVLIAGKTGSGKSYWIKKVMASLDSFIFYDPKNNHTELTYPTSNNLDNLIKLIQKGNKKVVFRPMRPDNDIFDNLCKFVYFLQNTTLIIDECIFHVSSNKILPWHETLMTNGRTRNIGVWNCTQRPRNIVHNTLISESEHIIVFNLKLETDRQKLADSFDELILKANELERFHYIYFNEREDKAEIMPPI